MRVHPRQRPGLAQGGKGSITEYVADRDAGCARPADGVTVDGRPAFRYVRERDGAGEVRVYFGDGRTVTYKVALTGDGFGRTTRRCGGCSTRSATGDRPTRPLPVQLGGPAGGRVVGLDPLKSLDAIAVRVEDEEAVRPGDPRRLPGRPPAEVVAGRRGVGDPQAKCRGLRTSGWAFWSKCSVVAQVEPEGDEVERPRLGDFLQAEGVAVKPPGCARRR